MTETMSQSGFAEFYGVSAPMVSKYLKKGLIPKEALITKGRRVRIIPDIAKKYLDANLNPAMRKSKPKLEPVYDEPLYTQSEALFALWKSLCAGCDIEYEKMLTDRLFSYNEIRTEACRAVDDLNALMNIISDVTVKTPEVVSFLAHRAIQTALIVLGMPKK